MMCTVCGAEPEGGRALCGDCGRRLDNPPGLCVEHIAWTDDPPSSSTAALVDQWGRPHYLRDDTVIGRLPDEGIAVLERSISRRHAQVTRNSDTWHVRDLGSRNGTRVADAPVVAPAALRSEQIITFGDVAFYFIARPELTAIGRIQMETFEQPRRQPGESPEKPPGATLRLAAPPGNVGGLVELNGVSVRLSPIQFAFVTLLAERICAEVDDSSLVRGYVRSSELVDKLPWDTPAPVANNVKQVVRRVRSALQSAGLGDVIESRHRFGYRLRLIPQTRD